METIYCPKCGAQAASKQKFCRACGQDLLAVAALLKGQTAIDVWKRGPMLWATGLLITGTALGSVVKILSKQGINVAGEMTPYLMVLALLLVFGGVGWLAYLALNSIFPHRRLTPPATASPTTKMQSELAEPAPTITERTTELIERDKSHTPARITSPQAGEAGKPQ